MLALEFLTSKITWFLYGPTDRRTDMAISTWMLILIENIYTLWGGTETPLSACYIHFRFAQTYNTLLHLRVAGKEVTYMCWTIGVLIAVIYIEHIIKLCTIKYNQHKNNRWKLKVAREWNSRNVSQDLKTRKTNSSINVYSLFIYYSN